MNLLRQVCRSDRTGVDVQSDEDEGAVMIVAVFAHVPTSHVSHVRAKIERLSESGSGARPTNLGIADDTIKVSDL